MLDTGNAKACEARQRVIYGDTDQMGVVYYANYFRYFELSRSEWFRAHGGSYIELEKSGLLLPVVEAQCSYRASARYEDLLVIKAWVATLRRASLTFEYEIRKEGEEPILVTGQTTHACITREGRPTRLPQAVMELFRK
ncbi:MAG: thioesterase family protein [Myxococcaceae bacterium]